MHADSQLNVNDMWCFLKIGFPDTIVERARSVKAITVKDFQTQAFDVARENLPWRT